MLESFTKLGSGESLARKQAGFDIFAHLLLEEGKGDRSYAVERLVRGLQSQKADTRTGSYSTLAAFLALRKLGPEELREVVTKTLTTDGQSTKKERRLVYVGRILSGGLILRTVSLPQLLEKPDLLTGILEEAAELGGRRRQLLELATPFILHLLQQKEMTEEVFKERVWPSLLPLFHKEGVKKEEKEEEEEEGVEEGEEEPEGPISAASLEIALTAWARNLKKDFSFLHDLEKVVKTLLVHRHPRIAPLIEQLIRYVKETDNAEAFWAQLISQMRSSHFETVCTCLEKSMEAGLSPALVAKEEVIVPVLSVFRNPDASEQYKMATKALKSLLHFPEEMGKKERKAVIKVLFGGSPNLLHEYQKLLPILNPFLTECGEKDLTTLASVLEKNLEKKDEKETSTRMSLTYLRFLIKVACQKKAGDELQVRVGKKLLSLALGKETLSEEGDRELVKRTSIEAFKSLMTSKLQTGFLDEMVSLVTEDLATVCADEGLKKLVKKGNKVRMGEELDPHLKTILGSYILQAVLDQEGDVLEEAKTGLEEAIALCKQDGSEGGKEIIAFILNHVVKEVRPPFDYEALFSRLMLEGKVGEDVVQELGEAVDVELGEGGDEEEEDSDEEDEDSDDGESEDEKDQDKMEEEDDEDEDKPKATIGRKSKPVKDEDEGGDSDASESSIDMDAATEDDLKRMDQALARVFATKKKVKEEEAAQTRSTMRIYRLLEILLSRSQKSCNISLPLLLLQPLIHALQASIIQARKGKGGAALSLKVTGLLNRLNGIKKFENIESVEKGTLLSLSKELTALLKQKKNKPIADLLGDSVILLTKAYLSGSKRSKGEDTGFLTLYCALLDLKGEKRGDTVHSSLITSALTTLPSWKEGKDAVVKGLVETAFDSSVRLFRRTQFLAILRAAMGDKDGEWKQGALTLLLNRGKKYFHSGKMPAEEFKFSHELLLTLADSSSSESVISFLKQVVSQPGLEKVVRRSPALLKLIGSKGHLEEKGESGAKKGKKRKAVGGGESASVGKGDKGNGKKKERSKKQKRQE